MLVNREGVGNAQNNSCAVASSDGSMRTEDPMKDVSRKKNETASVKFVTLDDLKNSIDRLFAYLMEHEKY